MFALVFGLLGPAAAAGGDAFVFGTASAAWQYEGAADSRGDTIWDDFCSRDRPDGAPNCHNQSATATDQYNLTRLASDIELMRALGTTAYRLSLAWSRILPTGAGAVNEAAVGHYRTVLSMLRAGGIEPYVTLFHFDLPSPLERMGGWLNHSMADTFADYAGVCFHAFGDLVRFWITINEAHTIATAGYLYGVAAPGRCSNRAACAEGDGLTEPYLAAHTLLRAHAKAAAAYRVTQEPAAAATAGGVAEGRGATRAGSITMVISGDHTEPWNTSSTADAAAAQRRQEFQIGWFADPMWFGDYPLSMRSAPGMRGGGGGGGSGGGGRGRGGGGRGGRAASIHRGGEGASAGLCRVLRAEPLHVAVRARPGRRLGASCRLPARRPRDSKWVRASADTHTHHTHHAHHHTHHTRARDLVVDGLGRRPVLQCDGSGSGWAADRAAAGGLGVAVRGPVGHARAAAVGARPVRRRACFGHRERVHGSRRGASRGSGHRCRRSTRAPSAARPPPQRHVPGGVPPHVSRGAAAGDGGGWRRREGVLHMEPVGQRGVGGRASDLVRSARGGPQWQWQRALAGPRPEGQRRVDRGLRAALAAAADGAGAVLSAVQVQYFCLQFYTMITRQNGVDTT